MDRKEFIESCKVATGHYKIDRTEATRNQWAQEKIKRDRRVKRDLNDNDNQMYWENRKRC